MTGPVGEMTARDRLADSLLPGVPVDLVLAAYAATPGNEIESGKFASPESSAALAANAFGWFLERPGELPALPGTEDCGWPASSVRLEAILRFPWRGGRHPCLDALIETDSALIGVESKRYEPWRAHKVASLSEAYWRPVWGERMAGYERVRDGIRDGSLTFLHLDAAQLVKHAFGLRTEAHRTARAAAGGGRRAVLVYVYAESATWPTGRTISRAVVKRHREEVSLFASLTYEAEVTFVAIPYAALIAH